MVDRNVCKRKLRRRRFPRVTIMWRPSPPWSLVNRDLTIRPGRRRGRWRAKSSARIHRSIACGRKERRRGRRRVTRSRGRDPLNTPPDDRCGSRRHPQFVLASDRADDRRQKDRRFEGTPPRKDGYGKLITVDPEGYPSRLVNRFRNPVGARLVLCVSALHLMPQQICDARMPIRDYDGFAHTTWR